MSFLATRFETSETQAWDEFVRVSRNGTFLIERGFMDYHADRFVDHSLLIHDQTGRLCALLPANWVDGELHSHGGLTYGGLILGPRSSCADVVEMLQAIQTYMYENKCTRLHYKTIPWIYHRQPCEDDRYGLFVGGAQLSRRDVLSVVARDDRLRFQERRRRGAKSAQKAGVKIVESQVFSEYWQILDATLRGRYGVSPVHSLDEIELLHAKYPEQIRLFVATHDGATIAGVVVFETSRVAHVQYISAGETGRSLGALDALFDHLLSSVFRDKPYFDFGISNEEQGRVLNIGLLEQKEGFGARAVAHDYYLLECGGAQ